MPINQCGPVGIILEDWQSKGAIVRAVNSDSVLFGIVFAGDCILSVGGKPVDSAADASCSIREAKDVLVLQIQTKPQLQFITLCIGAAFIVSGAVGGAVLSGKDKSARASAALSRTVYVNTLNLMASQNTSLRQWPTCNDSRSSMPRPSTRCSSADSHPPPLEGVRRDAIALIGVFSFQRSLGAADRRAWVRSTSGSHPRVVRRFIMARDERAAVEASEGRHGDVAYFDISRSRLSHGANRSVFGKFLLQNAYFRWALCQRPPLQFIGRLDDDVAADLPGLLARLDGALMNFPYLPDEYSLCTNECSSRHLLMTRSRCEARRRGCPMRDRLRGLPALVWLSLEQMSPVLMNFHYVLDEYPLYTHQTFAHD